MQNYTLDPYNAPVFSPPPYAVAVNALFFASLAVVLMAAFLCMLVKGWIRELDRKLRGIPDLQKRAVIKELREQGLVRWRLPEMITILPSLIHLSLVLFFIGLALYLLQIHKLPAFLAISIFGLGVLLYVLSIFISAIDDFSPFRSLYSRALGVLYRRLYSRLMMPPLLYRLSSFMALPQTTTERLHEQTSTFRKAHEPLAEQAILDPRFPSSKQLISQTSAPILNKLWSSVGGDTSVYAKNISTSILLQLDDLNIRPPHHWQLPWVHETSSLSIKEAKCLIYNTCMQVHIPATPRFWETIHASVELLEQRSDPWLNLVTRLIRSKVGDCNWGLLKSSVLAEGSVPGAYMYLGNNGLGETELLRAISDVEIFLEEQWCFVVSAIYTLFVQDHPNDIHVLARILVKLLQRRVVLNQPTYMPADEYIDFWLYVMMTLLNPIYMVRPSTLVGEVQHARDIKAYGKGYFRNPNFIRQLLRLSRDRGLDPSVMRGCLVTILCILILNDPMNQQQIRLVNQYLEIIGEEMDVTAWSTSFSELLTDLHTGFHVRWVAACLLRGGFFLPDRWGPTEELATMIFREFDLKLTTASSQPTTSILKVIGEVFRNSSRVAGLDLQNAWLSLHLNNLTHSSHISGIPVIWSPDCTSIASQRIDLYDRGTVQPEMDLVVFFLTSHSASIARRALRWYLRLDENAPLRGEVQYFVSFPIIFRKGLSTNETRESWLLLADLLLRNWNDAPREWRSHFVEIFFGYESSQANTQSTMQESVPAPSVRGGEEGGYLDIEAQKSTTRSDGLGWMEDLWMTVLRPLVRTVCITPIEPRWFDLSGMMHAVYPQSAEPERRSPLPEPSAHAAPVEVFNAMPDEARADAPQNDQPKSAEESLEDSARGLLRVLTLLLEAGATSMPITLLDRLEHSSLLSDERLSHDTDSLRRIKAVLNRTQQG